MTGLGTLLQEARLQRGLTIEEVADRTKMRTQFLTAIEEGDFNQLPDQAYIRAFLRTYAKALGLEPESIILEYEARLMPGHGGELISIRERRSKARIKKRLQFAITFGVLVMLGVLSYFLYRLMVT